MRIGRYFYFLRVFFVVLLVCDHATPKPYMNGNLKHNYLQKSEEGCPPEFLTFRRYRYLHQLCRKQTTLAVTAVAGLKEATRECQFQMRDGRWDCTQNHPGLNSDFTLLHEPPITRYAFKETAFLVALSSAGVSWSIARACTSGRLNTCRCNINQHAIKQSWEWGGCSYSVKFGLVTSRRILMPKITSNGDELMLRVYKHNLKAGRLAVKQTIAKMCKCHGVSGSCQMKTCWKSTSDMRHIGNHLKSKFDRAEYLRHSNSPNNDSRVSLRDVREPDLVYFQMSPSFCDASTHLRTFGVTGRVCKVSNGTHSVGDCDKMCCDRGYFSYDETIQENCNCKFHWCCEVLCEKCSYHKRIYRCR